MALSVKVGSFAKSTGAATVSQSVTGVGFQPKAIIFWSIQKTSSGSWSSGFGMSVGLTSGASNSGSGSCQVLNGAAGNAFGPGNSRTAAKAITFNANNDIVAIAECSLTSFDADGFTLSWTTNNATAYIIHYMAIGGADLTSAAVVSWTGNNTANSSQSVTGVGFKPDCVIHLPTTSAGAPAAFNSFGAMDKSGNQFGASWDAGGFSVTNESACIDDPTSAIQVLQTHAPISSTMQSPFASMDSDGFTVRQVFADNLTNYALCLKGISARCGTICKTTAPATVSQAITGLGFQPTGVIMATASQTSSAPTAGGRLSLGATDGSAAHNTAIQFKTAVAVSVTAGIDVTNKLITVANNDSGTTDATCSLTSFDADGFTLSWTTNNANAANISFLAIGNSPAAAGGLLVNPGMGGGARG